MAPNRIQAGGGAGAVASEAVPLWPSESTDPPWPPKRPLDVARCGTHLPGRGSNCQTIVHVFLCFHVLVWFFLFSSFVY